MALTQERPLVILDSNLEISVKELIGKGIVKSEPFAGPNGSPQTSHAMFNPSLEIAPNNTLISLVRGFGKDESSEIYNRNEGMSRQFLMMFPGNDLTKKPVMLANAVLTSNIDAEDARITNFGNGIYGVTYIETFYIPGMDMGFQPALALTKDFQNYYPIHMTGMPKYTKDFVLFPEKIDGKYVSTHRPTLPDEVKHLGEYSRFDSGKQSIFISYSKNLRDWHDHKIMLTPDSDEEKVGAGAPPIKTDDGWLYIYHTVKVRHEKGRKIRNYSSRIALLDLHDPSRVLSITDYVMKPDQPFEINDELGLEHVFPEGAKKVIIQNGKAIPGFIISYGAADESSVLAFMTEEYLQDTLHSNSTIRFN
jgi:predicted GH43/DUF377 family glycosyl hydrolase